MILATCTLLLCLLQQVSESEVRPPSQELRADPPALTASVPRQEQTPKPKPDLGELLSDPDMQLTAIDALEAEVTSLRGILGGLVSKSEMGMDLLQEIEGPGDQLKSLGVSDERAEAVRLLSNDVRALRARLRLMDLRAPTETKILEKNPNEGFDPLEDQATAEAEALANRLSKSRISGANLARRQRSLYPSREALLAFKQGDYIEVVEILEPFELHEIETDALYALGCALVRGRELDRARQVFERVMSFGDRQTLKRSAKRQLTRIDYLKHGIVGPGAQLAERTGR